PQVLGGDRGRALSTGPALGGRGPRTAQKRDRALGPGRARQQHPGPDVGAFARIPGVVPAQAGTHRAAYDKPLEYWIPALHGDDDRVCSTVIEQSRASCRWRRTSPRWLQHLVEPVPHIG